MALSRNDVVVVPGWGVGRVEAVEAMQVGEQTVRTYRISFGEESGRYWVPTDRVEAEGLRPPMDDAEIARTWELICSHELADKRAHWRKRQMRYHQMLMSNDPAELAKLIGELVAVQAHKRDKRQALSVQERELLDRAVRLMIGEIAAATGQEPDDVRATMDQTIAAAA